RVAAAADLRFAFEDLAAEFHRRRADVTVQVTYGSSGQLFAQLSNKAPFDMFLSADAAYPRQLVEAGRASKETQFRYGTGRLVVWTPDGSALDLNKLGLSALLDPSVRRIAIANPAHAPYGRAAESALKTLGVYDKVADKLVLGESVAQAAQFVQSGSADVGIIALSLAVATDLRSSGRFWEIPAAAYPPMVQEGVILSWCQDEDAADALRLFITSADGKAILAQYGFSTPGE
ncbi:MAG: molybdate ABC transporter substrate-binding protein, partial [Planctomycetota bacterium]|nr:molybdate ABC transporter substrate-binding protein [Planctomycetota bacterium]